MKNADSFFAIGSTHEICQDYVISNPDKLYTILADGCSTAKDTDIGARLLVKTEEQNLDKGCPMCGADYKKIIFQAEANAKVLGLDKNCLHATLLTLRLSEDGDFLPFVYGDGVIVARKRISNLGTPQLRIMNLEYPSGAPYYLRYELDNSKTQWEKIFGSSYFQSHTFLDIESNRTVLGEKIQLEENSWEGIYELSEYDMVAVLSDGIHSFFKKEKTDTSIKTTPINYIEVIQELFKFKSMNGQFVKRRCKRFFKECKEKGWEHYDDFSIGVIYAE